MQAAFALDVNVLPLQAGQRERVPETGFRFAVPVAGGVIEEIDPLRGSGPDHFRGLRDRQRRHTHAAQDDGGSILRSVHHIDHFHKTSSSPY